MEAIQGFSKTQPLATVLHRSAVIALLRNTQPGLWPARACSLTPARGQRSQGPAYGSEILELLLKRSCSGDCLWAGMVERDQEALVPGKNLSGGLLKRDVVRLNRFQGVECHRAERRYDRWRYQIDLAPKEV